jgi:DNA invertase Pin-like site-specific DNA recombinase
LAVEQWIEETISGTKSPEKRLLGSLLSQVEKGDLIICSELSRLGDNIQSKVLAFAFGLSAEIERDLISQRTKEALARRRSEGVILGRPVGRKSCRVKLSGHEKEIQAFLDKHTSKSAIGRIFGVNRMTVDSFLKERMKK